MNETPVKAVVFEWLGTRRLTAASQSLNLALLFSSSPRVSNSYATFGIETTQDS
jgi:hypothetical protein